MESLFTSADKTPLTQRRLENGDHAEKNWIKKNVGSVVGFCWKMAFQHVSAHRGL
jgi:hypothetical protein